MPRNYFRQSDPIKTLVATEGLASLFAKKVQYCKKHMPSGRGIHFGRTAKYALLSAMTKAHRGDFHIRAINAFNSWTGFSASLTPAHLVSAANTQISVGVSGQDFAAVIGKASSLLPAKKLARAIEILPDGAYIILTKMTSNIRKNPKFVNAMSAIFGPKARINKAVIYNQYQYLNSVHGVYKLIEHGHVGAYHFTKQDQTLSISASQHLSISASQHLSISANVEKTND